MAANPDNNKNDSKALFPPFHLAIYPEKVSLQCIFLCSNLKVKSAGKTSSSMADQRVQKHNDDLQKRKGEPQNATVEPLPSNDRKEVQNTVRLLTTETK